MNTRTARHALVAFLALAAFAANAWALTSSKGAADRITIRPGYSQDDGSIELRDAVTGVVTHHYWGGGRRPAAPAPTAAQIDRLVEAHVNGRSLSLDYTNVVTALYGTSRCWDGGTMYW